MMRVSTKLSIALTLFLFISSYSIAQDNHYSVIRMFDQGYTSLTGGTDIGLNENNTKVNFNLPDHEFRFFDEMYEVGSSVAIEITWGGQFKFNNSSTGVTIYGNTTSMGYRDATSKVLFLEEGDYFKFEFVNIGYKSPNASPDDYTNYQIWFNKTNNEVEYHFGASSHVDIPKAHGDAAGPLVGAIQYAGSSFKNISLLQGVPNLCQSQTNFGTLNGVPEEGTVYVLKNQMVSVNKVEALNATIYPNPASNVLNIQLTNATTANVAIYDVLGNKVMELDNISETTTVDISALKSGQYIARVEDGVSVANVRFVKF